MVLTEGDKAPPFSLNSDTQGKVSLRDFAGKTLVLYFYPRDNTPGCTREAKEFTATRQRIEKAGGTVVGVSRDSLQSHQKFRSSCDLDILLLSDPDLEVHKAYGAWGEKTMYGKKVEGVLRTTFLIQNGKITRVFKNVKVDGHAEAVLAAISGASSTPTAKKTAAKKSTAKATTKKRSTKK